MTDWSRLTDWMYENLDFELTGEALGQWMKDHINSYDEMSSKDKHGIIDDWVEFTKKEKEDQITEYTDRQMKREEIPKKKRTTIIGKIKKFLGKLFGKG